MTDLVTTEVIELSAPGRPKVKAHRLRDLAVHKTLSDPKRWTITHLPSGLHFGFYWSSCFAAIRAMQKINDLTPDWGKLKPWEIEAHSAAVWRVCTDYGGRRFQFIPRITSLPERMNGY